MVISRESPGFVRNARNVVFSILLPIYFGLPWLTWNGHPFIRLDIPGRKFYLIGNVFMPLEGQFLFLFLLSLGLSLFFFTSLIGRVWCGWACPQTVFTELFDGIGRFFLGKKYGKKDVTIPEKILLHSVWILISLVGSFSWIAYFAEPYNMISDMRSAAVFTEQAWPYFLLFFAATLYLDMTFVREQFCKYACPYAR
ncbi:MAG: 4Fe-4S binding protein, partial [Leptospira sp.]|nr:4Fe-4S binding protein [Leptospira sp.]